jgi:hypothetical protein
MEQFHIQPLTKTHNINYIALLPCLAIEDLGDRGEFKEEVL